MSGIWEYNRGLNLECIRLMKQLKDLEESTHEEMKDLDKEILELKSNVSNLRNANNRLNNELKEKQDFSNRERYWSSKFKDLQTELFNKENELDRIKEVLRGV